MAQPHAVPISQSPILCYVTDRHAFGEAAALVAQIARASAAGVQWIQIREKDLSARELLALSRDAVRVAEEHGAAGSRTRILINDRLDVAIAAGAAGVHLPESSLPVAAVNEWRRGAAVPKDFLIGASCHLMETATAAQRDGADYVVFGPVFPTPSKLPFGEPQGLGRLREITTALQIPVLAIGGITAENAAKCIQVGAAGVAAIRMFQEASDMGGLVRELRLRHNPPRGLHEP
jgi:thiamine-phosphate pyrophosphorylase